MSVMSRMAPPQLYLHVTCAGLHLHPQWVSPAVWTPSIGQHSLLSFHMADEPSARCSVWAPSPGERLEVCPLLSVASSQHVPAYSVVLAGAAVCSAATFRVGISEQMEQLPVTSPIYPSFKDLKPKS